MNQVVARIVENTNAVTAIPRCDIAVCDRAATDDIVIRVINNQTLLVAQCYVAIGAEVVANKCIAIGAGCKDARLTETRDHQPLDRATVGHPRQGDTVGAASSGAIDPNQRRAGITNTTLTAAIDRDLIVDLRQCRQ